MARPLRIEYAGALYHVTSRGNARQRIYRNDADREDFLKQLSQVIERYRLICYAYCLMGNHYHLLIETVEAHLSRGVRQLNGVYTQRFNRRHRRVGHLFQGRFKGILVEKEAHLLELCRYVVLNPVRSKGVEDPSEWRWSSYRATVGEVKSPKWLSSDWVLRQFGGKRKEARQRYREFVRNGIGATSPWANLRGQIYLGSEAFCERFMRDEPLQEIPRPQRRPVRPKLGELFAGQVNVRRQAVRAYLEHGYRFREIGEQLSVHYATVSRWVRAVEEDGRREKTR